MTRIVKRTAALSAAIAIACGGAAAHGQAPDSRMTMNVIPAGVPVENTGARAPRPHDAVAIDSSVPRATWDIDVRSYEDQPRVAHYVELFSGHARAHIAAQLTAGSRYESMIRAQMRAGGIPEDMYYLAMIESGFDPNAYSRAAAVGMWQFMSSTARDAGLRVDWWVDERRDPVRSTRAAVGFIRELRDQFGSLYLAAAAYNGGPGRISRGLLKYASAIEGAPRDAAFFLLAEKDYLKNETQNYVPQLIAAALIGKEPARYGMELHALPVFAYDSVVVPPGTPLAAVAKAARASSAEIVELNPHLLRGMTPPRQSSIVRIPLGMGSDFSDAFLALPAEALVATRTVESRKGDTADHLAEAHGISARALRGFNPALHTLKSGMLAPGQTILLPSLSVAQLALSVPDPAIENFRHQVKHPKGRRGQVGPAAKQKSGMHTKQGAGSRRASARVHVVRKHSKSLHR